MSADLRVAYAHAKSTYVGFKQQFSPLKSQKQTDDEYRKYTDTMSALLKSARKATICKDLTHAYNEMKNLVKQYKPVYGMPIGISDAEMDEIRQKYNKMCSR